MSSLQIANITDEDRDELEWALNAALGEQENYLKSGDMQLDYGDEWPELCKQNAARCRAIAYMRFYQGEAECWTDLAEEFERNLEPGGAK